MVGAVSGMGISYYQPYYSAPTRSQAVQNAAGSPAGLTRTAAIPAPQPGVPVQPVSPVPPADPAELDVEGLIRWMDNDPAAMAARSRIQYPGQEQGQDVRDPNNPVKDAQDALPDEKTESAQEVAESSECQTCKRRKYQDGSDDPGVSFKSPTHVSPEMAAAAVRGHENEHVTREQAKAEREDRHVVSQTVTYKTAICPECGRVYVAGGLTRTVTAANTDNDPAKQDEKDRPGFSIAA